MAPGEEQSDASFLFAQRMPFTRAGAFVPMMAATMTGAALRYTAAEATRNDMEAAGA